MNAQELIREIQRLDTAIYYRINHIQSVKDSASSSTSKLKPVVVSSAPNDKVGNAVCDYVDEEQVLNHYKKRREQLMMTVEKLDSESLELVMEVYILKSFGIETYARIKKRSRDWAFRVRDKALNTLDELAKEL